MTYDWSELKGTRRREITFKNPGLMPLDDFPISIPVSIFPGLTYFDGVPLISFHYLENDLAESFHWWSDGVSITICVPEVDESITFLAVWSYKNQDDLPPMRKSNFVTTFFHDLEDRP